MNRFEDADDDGRQVLKFEFNVYVNDFGRVHVFEDFNAQELRMEVFRRRREAEDRARSRLASLENVIARDSLNCQLPVISISISACIIIGVENCLAN